MQVDCAKFDALSKFVAGIVLACALSMTAFAEDGQTPFPRDEVKRLTAEIRKHPENDGLRRELIDLLRGRTLNTPSDKFYKLLESGAMLEDTGTPENLLKAIETYKRAANSAPWYVGTYMSLGMAYETAQDWTQARRYYDLFLYAGKDYSVVPAELEIIRDALQRVEGEIAKGNK
jgi:tetratricopeptide (TPR) repeat protein